MENWQQINPTPEYMSKQVQSLSELIQSMSGWNPIEAKTIIYWIIATYGFENIRKFAPLIVYGRYGTGKTTLLEIIETLADPPKSEKGDPLRAEMRLSGDLSDAVNRDKLAEGGTHCMDEADGFDEKYIPKVFDSFSAKMTVNVQAPSKGWEKHDLEVRTALVMHRRLPIEDPANEDRCIILNTRPVDLEGPGKQAPNMEAIKNYLIEVEKIANYLEDTWKDIPDADVNRPKEKWAAIRHVANELSDVEFIQHIDAEIRRAVEDKGKSIQDEPDIAVFRTVVKEAYYEGEFMQRVKTKNVRESLADEDIHLTSRNINKIAKTLGLTPSTVGGTSYIYLAGNEESRKAQLKAIADEIGFEDEALKDEKQPVL